MRRNSNGCCHEKVRQQLLESDEDGAIGRKLACQHPACAYWINEAQLKWVLPMQVKKQRAQHLKKSLEDCENRDCEC